MSRLPGISSPRCLLEYRIGVGLAARGPQRLLIVTLGVDDLLFAMPAWWGTSLPLPKRGLIGVLQHLTMDFIVGQKQGAFLHQSGLVEPHIGGRRTMLAVL